MKSKMVRPLPEIYRSTKMKSVAKKNNNNSLGSINMKINSIKTIITLKTNMGDINIELFPEYAPKTVKNFIELALGQREWTDPKTNTKTNQPLYDGTIFHRVISGFMIQGGDPLGNGTGGPGYKFEDEFYPGLVFDKPYLVAMANAGPNTNGSQFFITVVETPWLDNKHTIFGEVKDPKSQEIVKMISEVKTDLKNNKPIQDIVINEVIKL